MDALIQRLLEHVPVRYSGLYHPVLREKLGDQPTCEVCGLPLVRQQGVDAEKKVA